jgi:voltage-gated potassium channel
VVRIKERLSQVLDDVDSRSGRLFALFIQTLIVLSLVTFSLETLPNLSKPVTVVFDGIETATVAVFTLEYIARIYAAENRLGFMFSFYGIIDLVAIAPFYIATGMDLRAVRVFRLLRLLRILKLARYNDAIVRFERALVIAKEELLLFTAVALMLLYLSAVGIYLFENEAQPEQFKSVFHSLWWAIATLTTVGYGDIYPITLGGRIFTFFVLVVGLGIVAIPTGMVASALSQARRETFEKVRDPTRKGKSRKKHKQKNHFNSRESDP